MNKKKVNYLYFDDLEKAANAVKDNLENDYLNIIVKRELSWSKMIPHLLDNESSFEGLILDWRLDGEDDTKADFSSEALAQQCRRLQVDKINDRGFSKSFPIILCSAEPGFKKIHEKDTTSEDLFDGIFEKSDLEDQEDFLLSLSNAYRILRKNNLSIQDIVGLTLAQQEFIDGSLLSKIEEIKERQPHEMILFLTKEVLQKKGALINEHILAARFGVDMKSEGWKSIKEKIEHLKYAGILGDEGMWWADLINEWWSENLEGTILKFLSSSERIELLISKFDDLEGKLIKPELSKGAGSEEFWTVCFATKVPLAEVDGFILNSHLHYSWQEREYVCLDEAKNETMRGELWNSLLPFEVERLKPYFESTTKQNYE